MIAGVRHVDAGDQMLDLALRSGFASIAVVGTGKNVGKSVVVRSIVEAAAARSLAFALTSVGRDGEMIDVVTGEQKPRFFLRAGAIIACAQTLIPEAAGIEAIDVLRHGGPLGPIVIGRVREAAYYEVAGSHTAAGTRALIARLRDLGCVPIVVDGAIDRMAAIAGGEDAVIVVTGARRGERMDGVVEELRMVCARLRIPRYNAAEEHAFVDGVLDAERARRFAADERQIVVRDATKIVLRGEALRAALGRLRLRCERPLHVVACAVSPIGETHAFDAAEFVSEAARATGLPVFDAVSGLASA